MPAGSGTEAPIPAQGARIGDREGVYLDGADTPANREQGTRASLEALATALSD